MHGLGVNPADGALFIATHTGMFRAATGERRARRVAGRYQDTMGFTVVGPDRFLGSGHPDLREKLPPFLGLIASRDAGVSWRPISLLGEVDFHLLAIAPAASRSIIASGERRVWRSDNAGRSWVPLEAPSAGLLAWNTAGVFLVDADGRTWRAGQDARSWQQAGSVGGQPAAFDNGGSQELLVALHDGTIKRSSDAARSWTIRSQPQ